MLAAVKPYRSLFGLAAPINYMRVWYQPFLFYVLAVDFSFLAVSEFSARLPVALLSLLPIQFMLFHADYLSGYQERSAIRFDPNATRAVVDAIVAFDRKSPAPFVFLQDDGDNKGIRWKFYTRERGQDDL